MSPDTLLYAALFAILLMLTLMALNDKDPPCGT